MNEYSSGLISIVCKCCCKELKDHLPLTYYRLMGAVCSAYSLLVTDPVHCYCCSCHWCYTMLCI